MANLVNFTLPEHPFLADDDGRIIGMVGKGGITTYLPAGTSESVTASTASDNTALRLKYKNYVVPTVGSAGDSVVLPPAKAGMAMSVANTAASNAMDVFPYPGEAINALSADTALSVLVTKTILFVCFVNGIWRSNLTA